jgi:hypothetical protein
VVAGADDDRCDQRQRQQREQPRAPRATRRPPAGRFAAGEIGHQPVEVGVGPGRQAGVKPFLELVAVEPAG